jgi:hypothetical protein
MGQRQKPWPKERPTIQELKKLQDPTVSVSFAGRCFGLTRTKTYDRIRAGNFPVPVIRQGRSIVVPTLPLLRALGIEPEEPKRGRRAS